MALHHPDLSGDRLQSKLLQGSGALGSSSLANSLLNTGLSLSGGKLVTSKLASPPKRLHTPSDDTSIKKIKVTETSRKDRDERQKLLGVSDLMPDLKQNLLLTTMPSSSSLLRQTSLLSDKSSGVPPPTKRVAVTPKTEPASSIFSSGLLSNLVSLHSGTARVGCAPPRRSPTAKQAIAEQAAWYKAKPSAGKNVSRPRDAKTIGKPLKRKAREFTSRSAPENELEARKISTRQSEFEMPDYGYELMETFSRDEVLDASPFLPLDQDPLVLQKTVSLGGPTFKRLFINAVSASLLSQPNYKSSCDTTRITLVSMADNVAGYDAEFVLKVALYTRNELNIRGTANLLLAYAAFKSECRPYLRKYFSASIRLPSDWIDVAEQYQVFDDKSINFGSLPASLRRVMVSKFPDFDKYQLAKYNKDTSKKKDKKKGAGDAPAARGGINFRGRGGPRGRGGFRGRGAGRGRGGAASCSSRPGQEPMELELAKDSDDSDNEEEVERKSFTLKQLIRKLHITAPVEHVMCLVGKKYPEDMETFYQSRLPGVFEEERAGKRMKLPTPETWETQVSMKGNKASTWQDLIDHKKLPFMAMLRNLRNMIKAGISEKHHTWVLKKLSDEGAVIHSRQFPFRFFSAYEVLKNLEEDFNKQQTALVDEAVQRTEGIAVDARGRGRGARGRGRGGRGRGGRGGGQKKSLEEPQYDTRILVRYRKALDTAVKIATVHNVTPIKGTTIVFVQVDQIINSNPCTSARGLGPPRTALEVAVLLGLMCKYSSEQCHLVVYGSTNHVEIEIEAGTILDNMSRVLSNPLVQGMKQGFEATLPKKYLQDLIVNRTQVDNMIVLGCQVIEIPGSCPVDAFLESYRHVVNDKLLYVRVELSAPRCSFEVPSGEKRHENDVFIAGFSDQILRYVAERGGAGQLIHVEKIDEAYKLNEEIKNKAALVKTPGTTPAVEPQRPLGIPALAPRWRTARVFISSTFRDMHGERDLLTRFVFPELRARAQSRFVNVFEVDLRWGVTEKETKKNKTVELCLAEVDRCQVFVGILGERYGHVPDFKTLPDTPELEWVHDHPGASVTELEMRLAALNPDAHKLSCFYLRDNSFESTVPWEWRSDLVAENLDYKHRMTRLKDEIRNTNLPVFDGYPCEWGGVVGGKPILVGLEAFGQRVLKDVWEAIDALCPKESGLMDEVSHESCLHEAMMTSSSENFVGRDKLRKAILQKLQYPSGKLVALIGKPGTGKSALLAAAVHEYVSSPSCSSGLNVLVHFCGASPASTNIAGILRRLCHELSRRFSLDATIPEDSATLPQKFIELLRDGAASCSSPLVVLIDGLDLLENAHQGRLLDWIPEELPQNVVMVVSAQEGTEIHKVLQRRKPEFVLVGSLDLLEKASLVRSNLAQHRKVLDESPFNNQMKLLTAKKEANLPLYLALACEELRVFGVFEKILEKLKTLPHTIPALIQEILTRVEEDVGEELVRNVLCLLYCSRRGLEESELHGMASVWCNLTLAPQQMNVQEVSLQCPCSPEDTIPMATFARLLRSLQGFLRPTSPDSPGLLSLSHSEVQHAVQKRYMQKSVVANMETMTHILMAGYLREAWYSDSKSLWVASELPYHLACAGHYTELEMAICSLDFIQRKCELKLGHQLLEDFAGHGLDTKMAERERQKFLANAYVQQYRAFVAKHLHILSLYPALTLQQALNEPGDTYPSQAGCEMRDGGLSGVRMLFEWANKRQTQDACLQTIHSTNKETTCVNISGDGRYLACGSADCVVRIYAVETGKELWTFGGHSDRVTSVCFAGKNRLVVASVDNTLSLWDVADGHKITTLKKHTRPVVSVSSTKSGDLLASAGWDCTVRLWRASDGKYDGEIKHPRPVTCVAFHPEGQLLATGCWDMTIKIFEVMTKTRKAVLRGHISSVRDIAYSPSGSHIASAALDGEVKLWSSKHGSQVGTIQGHSLPINRLTFSPLGHELVTVADDWKVKLWSGNMGQLVEKVANKEVMPVSCVRFHPEGHMVVAGYNEGQVRAFQVEGGHELWTSNKFKKSVSCVEFSPDGLNLICASENGAHILLADAGTVKTKFADTGSKVMSAAYGCSFIALTTEDVRIHLYKVPPGGFTIQVLNQCGTYTGHSAPITGCAFNDEESMLATCGRDGVLMIWKVMGGSLQQAHMIHAHSDWINDLAWAGDFIVTVSNDFDMKLWTASTAKEKIKFEAQKAIPSKVAYKYGCIISSYLDGTVCVWSHKGTHITTLHGHKQRANDCDIYVKVKIKEEEPINVDDWGAALEQEDWQNKHAKSRLDKQDVRVLKVLGASCSDDGSLNIWKPLEAAELGCLTGHSNRVISVTCGASGVVATSSLDKTVRLWQPQKATVSPVGSHGAAVTAVVVSSSGHMLLTASRDGWVHLWGSQEKGYMYKGRVQVDEKAVSSLCFMGQDRSFAAVSESGFISKWQITQAPPNKLTAKKTWWGKSEGPLTSVAWDEKTSSAMHTPVLLCTSWTGALQVWSTKKPNTMLTEQKRHKGWALDLSCATHIGQHAVTVGMDLQVIGWATDKGNAAEHLVTRHTTQVLAEESANSCNESVWASSVCVQVDEVLVGDSQGHVTRFDPYQGWRPSKQWLHQGEITAIVFHAGHVFTGSADSTIKVWQYQKGKDLKQVGHYFCQAPVTSLDLHKGSGSSRMTLVSGDQLGNVDFFAIHVQR